MVNLFFPLWAAFQAFLIRLLSQLKRVKRAALDQSWPTLPNFVTIYIAIWSWHIIKTFSSRC